MNKERVNMAINDLKHYVINNVSLDAQDDFEMICKYIEKLEQENKQLKDNWNKLKEHLWNLRNVAFTKEFGNEWNGCLSFNEDILPIINKMQELEKGDSNE